jgi:DNA-binding phage protein
MIKKKTSPLSKKSLKNTPLKKIKSGSKLTLYDPTAELADESFIAMAVIECLKNNDPEGVIEVLNAHYQARGRLTAASASGLATSTFYSALKSKNPTLKTLAKLMSSLEG